MKKPEVIDAPVGEESSPGQQLIRDLRSFFCKSGGHALSLDRPSDWHCPPCNVWGRDRRPATCWCCGTEGVDYRVAPSMTGGHRFHEPNGQESP
jgi:hypothetical protein